MNADRTNRASRGTQATWASRARLAIVGVLALGGAAALCGALLPAVGLAATSAPVPPACVTTPPPTTTSPPPTTAPPTKTSPPPTSAPPTITGPDSTPVGAAYPAETNGADSTGTLPQLQLRQRTQLWADIHFNLVQTFTLTARLTSSGGPVCGQTVIFGTGFHRLCTATTNAYGVAFCVLNGSQTLLVEQNTFTIWARYAGNAEYYPSFATALITIFP